MLSGFFEVFQRITLKQGFLLGARECQLKLTYLAVYL